MEITLDYLMKGVSVMISDNLYLPAKEYVTPFIEEMKKHTNHFVVKVNPAKEAFIHNGEVLKAFNKVWIQAILPEDENGIKVAYNMMYALDIRKPIYKFSKGYITSDRTQVILDPKHLIIGEIKSGETIPDDFRKLFGKTADIKCWLDSLRNTVVVDRHKLLGEMVTGAMLTQIKYDEQKTMLSPSDILAAYSAVYVDTIDGAPVVSKKEASLMDFYTHITEHICADNKDIFSVCEKTLIVNQIFMKQLC